ncbi:MAG: hypothetical protein GY698_09965 [Actinomycetia bacterium]|nr:hypothetical protein [Actinomycetes bacterium]
MPRPSHLLALVPVAALGLVGLLWLGDRYAYEFGSVDTALGAAAGVVSVVTAMTWAAKKLDGRSGRSETTDTASGHSSGGAGGVGNGTGDAHAVAPLSRTRAAPHSPLPPGVTELCRDPGSSVFGITVDDPDPAAMVDMANSWWANNVSGEPDRHSLWLVFGRTPAGLPEAIASADLAFGTVASVANHALPSEIDRDLADLDVGLVVDPTILTGPRGQMRQLAGVANLDQFDELTKDAAATEISRRAVDGQVIVVGANTPANVRRAAAIGRKASLEVIRALSSPKSVA